MRNKLKYNNTTTKTIASRTPHIIQDYTALRTAQTELNHWQTRRAFYMVRSLIISGAQMNGNLSIVRNYHNWHVSRQDNTAHPEHLDHLKMLATNAGLSNIQITRCRVQRIFAPYSRIHRCAFSIVCIGRTDRRCDIEALIHVLLV